MGKRLGADAWTGCIVPERIQYNYMNMVAVPTDKTNSFRTMDIERYKMEVNKHLSERATVIERAKLTEIHHSCFDKLNELQEIASEKELTVLDERIKSKAIRSPKSHQRPQGTRPRRNTSARDW